jgi:hypothetical protein
MYNKTWVEKTKKFRNESFYNDSVLVIAYPVISSIDDRKALLSNEVSL